MKKIFIVSAKRTPIGKFMGSLSTIKPGQLGAMVIKAILEETGMESSKIDSVIAGNVLSAGQGQGVARQCAIYAGIPAEVPAYSINMVCGSGMKAVMNAVSEIRSGAAAVIIAGGVENMSDAGYILPSSVRNGIKMGNFNVVDHMVNDGLTDVFNNYHMGITAENVAEKSGISREAQDAFAYRSQQKAIAAVDGDKFKEEIVPVEIVSRKETVVFDKDEFPNRTSTPEKLAALRPAFKKDGTVTAGNASGINDGASFVMLADEEAVAKYGLEPLAEIVAVAESGVAPEIMGLGPVPAIRKVLQRAGMKLSDMEIIELNEAFAAQSLGVIESLCDEHGVSHEWMDERCNVHGGAIALGHPIGASGNRIIVSLVHEMKMYGKKVGLASLCIGGGMGTAIIVKRP
ncbi:MAG: acetyl-CoA acetyltransferase [Bacteroidia bacterium 43-41]|nr:MAG: acetyl-CoA acetyltransferase [Bacteroidia bacterium 43-41]